MPGAPEQQHAVRDPRAQTHVPIRSLQEVDDLGKLGLRLVDSRHVVEGHLDFRGVDPARLRTPEVAEAAEPAGTRLRAAGEEQEQADEEESRPEPE